jgi:hypothetical protein
MPKIVTRCPVSGPVVPTGLTTETIIFRAIPDDLPVPLTCPACGLSHEWRARDAWIEVGYKK